jgi:hypothetical protein
VSAPAGLLIVDGHENLSMSALADGRDYLSSAHAIRAAEASAGFDGRATLYRSFTAAEGSI